MDSLHFQVADDSHMAVLLPLVRAYHDFEQIVLSPQQRREALWPLLGPDSQFGRIWLIFTSQKVVGYVALCFGYSIELGGRDAFIDELFIIEEARGQGFGRQTLEFVIHQSASLKIAALHLEVARTNDRAKRLYLQAGFAARDRYHLMTFKVASN
ncbi:GNAT family N-acetyltransferase [Acaryochloris sp. 'Moss Beach']|uniref:GNAT family N-acetyltransferase n=1 Tax=Acaryochloris sp. 'Moss Beach' TaxID=2740837 RepID=UPI001F404FF4|nr:GNAT family N-acetyltransferase [Acaryochloris sp. 'Moss Beach']UJB70950.1 GNAT family N-acetyltransferase [Acaryochloris sp. 'Moss Beach']